MGEKFTSRVGYLIRNFRIASDMTQKELADKCGLNESTIRNYELGNRYPDEATLLNIANNLGVSFYALSDPDAANIFSALHVLFDIEWAYGLRPTIKDGEVCFKFEERLPSAGPRPQEDLNNPFIVNSEFMKRKSNIRSNLSRQIVFQWFTFYISMIRK